MTAGLRQLPAFFRDVPGDRETTVRSLLVSNAGAGRSPSPSFGSQTPDCLGGAKPNWPRLSCFPLEGRQTVIVPHSLPCFYSGY